MSNLKYSLLHPDGREVPLIRLQNIPSEQAGSVTEPDIDTNIYLTEYYHPKEPLSTSIVLGIGAFALAGLIAGLSMVATRTESQPINDARAVPTNNNSLTASAERQANISAQAEAKLISAQLNKNVTGDTSRITVTLINGAILENTAKPNTGIAVYKPIIQDAILLSTPSNQQPDVNGNFLNGAWLGVIGPRYTTQSPMVVSMFQYDAGSMKFESGSEPTIAASIATTPANIVGQGIAHETIAFDTTTGQQFLYNDGSPVFVGETLTNNG